MISESRGPQGRRNSQRGGRPTIPLLYIGLADGERCRAGLLVDADAHGSLSMTSYVLRSAGIDELRASKISDYDFRHSLLTYLGRVSDNLSGLMYLAGRTQASTTSRYLHRNRQPQRRC